MLTGSDRKYDPHQRTKLPARGEQISANTLKKLLSVIFNLVQSGRGIEVERRAEKVFIHVASNGKGFGGTGGNFVATVTALPAIPTDGMQEVYWTSSGGGTGDNQVWRAYAGQTAWTPTQKFTSKSGTP